MVVDVTSAVVVDDVTVSFESEDTPVVALKNISFEVKSGGFVTMIGPSGCGKSTLLRAIADLVNVTSGSISVFGCHPSTARKKRDFAFVFQEATLLPWLTAIDNVRLPLEVGKCESQTDHPYADPAELLELVGLVGREGAFPNELSGGMRQRVAIARALVCRPRVLLMDEPFGALDEITRDRMNNELLKIWKQTGTTIIFVTHSIAEAAYLGQKTLVLSTPSRVVKYMDISLPDERSSELLDTMEFVKVTSVLRRLLAA